MKNFNDELLPYYERELAYLRNAGADFAEKHPKIAARLDVNGGMSGDPYMERLLESFAFMTGRIQYTIDNDFPQIPQALLEVLYPHYLAPVPSMSIARFFPDMTKPGLAAGYEVPRHTQVLARAHDGTVCRFRTCYPTALLPLEIEEIALEPASDYPNVDKNTVSTVLRIRIKRFGKKEILPNFSRLRFFLNSDVASNHRLYEIVFTALQDIGTIRQGAPNRIFPIAPKGGIKPVGFANDEDVLPYRDYAHPEYRLLQEFFTMPEKFLFFDVEGLESKDVFINARSGALEMSFDLLLMLRTPPQHGILLRNDSLLLGCTPIVNIFSKISEPVRIHHRSRDYRLTADVRRESTTEIHSIQSVSMTSDLADTTRRVEPFFSFNHRASADGVSVFWYGQREISTNPRVPGTTMKLSFVDHTFNPKQPVSEVVFAHVLCTNRHLAQQLSSGTKLEVEEDMPIKAIVCQTKPTEQRQAPLAGATYWRLISHLSLNYLSLANTPASLQALQEMLRIYNVDNEAAVERQIMGILSMRTQASVRRVGLDAWRGFCNGSRINLMFKSENYVGESPLLFSAVLNRFFRLYTSINSFTHLIVYNDQQQDPLKDWLPGIGGQQLL